MAALRGVVILMPGAMHGLGSASPPSGDAQTAREADRSEAADDRFRARAGGDVTRTVYEVRVIGALGPAAKEAFAELSVQVEPTATVLVGEMDQAGLHGLIDRIRALGLELVDIRRGRP